MNRAEVVTLCRMVRAYCPAQAMDEFTPDAWFDVLAGVGAEDALNAVKHLARSQSFIAPNEVRARVVYVRLDRIERGKPSLRVPDWIGELPEGDEQTIAYARWETEMHDFLADGGRPEDLGDVRAALNAAFTPTTEETA